MRISKNKFLFIALCLCCLNVAAQRKLLTPAETVAFKQKVTASSQNLRSLESDFVQTRQLSYLDNTILTSGKLYFKSPRKIRWEYLSPTPYLIIFDDQTMYTREGTDISSVDLAASKRLKGLNDLLAAAVQDGNMLDENRFEITCYRENSGFTAVLIPKEKALGKYIKQVELLFDSGSLLLKQVLLIDPSGDRTQLSFKNQRTNVQLPDNLFAMATSRSIN